MQDFQVQIDCPHFCGPLTVQVDYFSIHGDFEAYVVDRRHGAEDSICWLTFKEQDALLNRVHEMISEPDYWRP